ncbi:transcriptional regulator family: Fungal Specific TF [Penicillium waksmanii]|uniref:transcriptional regulator family: Fungal Specific TF n=1 Tax=Penicillium waksmanii TaxID=69791 RepID=UPI002547643F|nr:transcriptional regulator family: Fungal Specific TF [Penicillium waksmanii]KAJ5983657.1 transcriptional regulator family: Fungal Specific TF [Penicillium waksmanii]
MPRGERFTRSRTGCLPCRKKHEKCDERRPLCSFCAARGLTCQYPSTLKWVRRAQPTASRHRSRKEPQEPDSAGGPSGPLSLFSGNLFQSGEEKSAWEYYVRLVSSNVPALDGPDNPYRQLSWTALSSPVLLDTIVCIATEHMLNFGLGSVSTAAHRQQRMLRTIGQNLRLIEAGNGNGCETRDVVVPTRNCDHEALLTAIVLQGVVVAQSEDGILEPHVRCASFLMQTLDYFHQIPRSALTRMAVQRFAMVDVMLAIARQRRPYAPGNFILHQPDAARWDGTEPSFHEMTGCPQPLMCFLVRIAHLACDVEDRLEQQASISDLLAQAHRLENDLRSWGSHYTGITSGLTECERRPPLDILTECYYWTAHLLLARRVFRDPTRCRRVQHLTQTCFGLMDRLSTGCGPDSSLPQPFYLAAREAVTPTDRAWVRQKHRSMTEYYREQQRNMAMRLTERVWEITDELQLKNMIEIDPDQAVSSADRQIKALDAGSCLFAF